MTANPGLPTGGQVAGTANTGAQSLFGKISINSFRLKNAPPPNDWYAFLIDMEHGANRHELWSVGPGGRLMSCLTGYCMDIAKANPADVVGDEFRPHRSVVACHVQNPTARAVPDVVSASDGDERFPPGFSVI